MLDDAIIGTISLCQQLALALFDPGFTYFYVSIYISPCLAVSPKPFPILLHVSTPVEDSLVVD